MDKPEDVYSTTFSGEKIDYIEDFNFLRILASFNGVYDLDDNPFSDFQGNNNLIAQYLNDEVENTDTDNEVENTDTDNEVENTDTDNEVEITDTDDEVENNTNNTYPSYFVIVVMLLIKKIIIWRWMF